MMGVFSSKEEISSAIQNYEIFINDPKTLKVIHFFKYISNFQDKSYQFWNSARIWTDQEYKRLLEGLLKFFDVQV